MLIILNNFGIENSYADISGYRRMVGKLLYLNTTRGNITFTTQQLSWFIHAPTITHYNIADRVIENSPGQGIFLDRTPVFQLLRY
jgi:hypothetical protein